jgi:hypothetical protein
MRDSDGKAGLAHIVCGQFGHTIKQFRHLLFIVSVGPAPGTCALATSRVPLSPVREPTRTPPYLNDRAAYYSANRSKQQNRFADLTRREGRQAIQWNINFVHGKLLTCPMACVGDRLPLAEMRKLQSAAITSCCSPSCLRGEVRNEGREGRYIQCICWWPLQIQLRNLLDCQQHGRTYISIEVREPARRRCRFESSWLEQEAERHCLGL